MSDDEQFDKMFGKRDDNTNLEDVSHIQDNNIQLNKNDTPEEIQSVLPGKQDLSEIKDQQKDDTGKKDEDIISKQYQNIFRNTSPQNLRQNTDIIDSGNNFQINAPMSNRYSNQANPEPSLDVPNSTDTDRPIQTSVESTAIQQVGYDPQTQELQVQFKGGDGTVYSYPNVPEGDVEQFLNAPSKGRDMAYHIKPNFSVPGYRGNGNFKLDYSNDLTKQFLDNKKFDNERDADVYKNYATEQGYVLKPSEDGYQYGEQSPSDSPEVLGNYFDTIQWDNKNAAEEFHPVASVMGYDLFQNTDGSYYYEKTKDNTDIYNNSDMQKKYSETDRDRSIWKDMINPDKSFKELKDKYGIGVSNDARVLRQGKDYSPEYQDLDNMQLGFNLPEYNKLTKNKGVSDFAKGLREDISNLSDRDKRAYKQMMLDQGKYGLETIDQVDSHDDVPSWKQLFEKYGLPDNWTDVGNFNFVMTDGGTEAHDVFGVKEKKQKKEKTTKETKQEPIEEQSTSEPPPPKEPIDNMETMEETQIDNEPKEEEKPVPKKDSKIPRIINKIKSSLSDDGDITNSDNTLNQSVGSVGGSSGGLDLSSETPFSGMVSPTLSKQEMSGMIPMESSTPHYENDNNPQTSSNIEKHYQGGGSKTSMFDRLQKETLQPSISSGGYITPPTKETPTPQTFPVQEQGKSVDYKPQSFGNGGSFGGGTGATGGGKLSISKGASSLLQQILQKVRQLFQTWQYKNGNYVFNGDNFRLQTKDGIKVYYSDKQNRFITLENMLTRPNGINLLKQVIIKLV